MRNFRIIIWCLAPFFYSCSMEPHDMISQDQFKVTNSGKTPIYCYISIEGGIRELDTVVKRLNPRRYFYQVEEIAVDSTKLFKDSGSWYDQINYEGDEGPSVTLFIFDKKKVDRVGWKKIINEYDTLRTFKLSASQIEAMKFHLVYK